MVHARTPSISRCPKGSTPSTRSDGSKGASPPSFPLARDSEIFLPSPHPPGSRRVASRVVSFLRDARASPRAFHPSSPLARLFRSAFDGSAFGRFRRPIGGFTERRRRRVVASVSFISSPQVASVVAPASIASATDERPNARIGLESESRSLRRRSVPFRFRSWFWIERWMDAFHGSSLVHSRQTTVKKIYENRMTVARGIGGVAYKNHDRAMSLVFRVFRALPYARPSRVDREAGGHGLGCFLVSFFFSPLPSCPDWTTDDDAWVYHSVRTQGWRIASLSSSSSSRQSLSARWLAFSRVISAFHFARGIGRLCLTRTLERG